MGDRRPGGGGDGVRAGGACGARPRRQPAPDRHGDGDARDPHRVRSRQRAMGGLGRQPGSAFDARRHRPRAEGRARKAEDSCAGYRRRFRHEDHAAPGIRAGGARDEGRRTAGEMDRRPLRELSFRRAGARSAIRNRRRVRRGGANPGAAIGLRLQSRGVLFDRQHGDPHDLFGRADWRDVSGSGRLRPGSRGADQYHADGRLSRRRTPRSDLRDRAIDRRRGAGHGKGSGRAPPAQPADAERTAVSDARRPHFRQPRPGAADRRRDRGGGL